MTDTTADASSQTGWGASALTRSGRGFGLKLMLVCFLAALMAAPALMVFGVLLDRENRARSVEQEIGGVRGGEQTFFGPTLLIPYTQEISTTTWEDGEERVRTQLVRKLFVAHPDDGAVTAEVATEVLQRSIFKVPVYSSDLTFEAAFDLDGVRRAAGARALEWDAAVLLVGASSLRGARAAQARINGGAAQTLEPFAWEFAPPSPRADGRSVTPPSRPGSAQQLAAVRLNGLTNGGRGVMPVAAELTFTGARRLAFFPYAKETEVAVAGDWPDPSFDGGFLPETRSVADSGFSASWRIPFLARGAAATGDADVIGLGHHAATFGVSFVQVADVYSAVGRALKYAVMFIGFVFLAYFLFEVTSGRRAHAAQYVLVGLMQATFYLLLLSFAEQIGFDVAFAIAATAVVAATALYAGTVFGGWGHAGRAAAVFAAVYGLMYVLMRLEDYALLVGAVACFAALSLTMFLTRKVDWYGRAGA